MADSVVAVDAGGTSLKGALAGPDGLILDRRTIPTPRAGGVAAIDAIAEQFSETAGVVKVNVDDNTATAQRYGIKGIPTLILFNAGKEVERVVGATSKESISRMIEKHVSVTATA